MRRTDLITASLLLALGLITLFVVIPGHVAETATTDDLSAAFMPYVAAGLGTLSMAMLAITSLARPHSGDRAAPLTKDSWYFIGASIAILATAFVLMSSLGYLYGAAVVVGGFMSLARADFKVTIVTAVLLPLALWLLFERALGFPLP